MAINWSKRGWYIAKHYVSVAQANEALADPERVVFIPDYNSTSGESNRTIGYSPSAGAILTVITVFSHEDDVTYGANAWKANARDRRYYEQGGTD
ncbi:transposase [Mycobacterium sp. ITM-2016-00316]|uniref:transposase n=1 Tax=Mycobacterium sp. ITM-2016-00316 TaxID=2099695 RepID=UPI000CF976D1|nr:transposase [Mycobacterium sp. ITM-2016-00316]WNG80177.1 transposase [Mycobacterium sp. ITM-2016-00316]